MTVARALIPVVLIAGLTGCSSSPKALKKIENHLRVLERGDELDRSNVETLCLNGTTTACALLGRPAGLTQQLATVQGYTDSSSTMIAVTAPSEAQLLFAVVKIGKPENESQPGTLKVLRAAKTYQRDFSKWRVDHLTVDGLDVKSKYEIWMIGPDGMLWDRREFQALNTLNVAPKIAVASCLDDGFRQEEGVAWEKVKTRSPDVLFLIGDNVYTDKYLSLEAKDKGADPQILWNRNVETRNLLAVFRWSRLVPVFATWDDHDFGKNDGDSSYANKQASKEVFEVFFPRPDKTPVFEKGPGVASRLLAFGGQFIFFDDRSFRTPNRQDTDDQSHFGKAQEDWALNAAAAEKVPVWFISGDQFFGAYHSFESFEGNHAKNFAAFKSRLKQLSQPFVFISGDRHLIELMQISNKEVGISTFELTTSALHARTFPQNMDLNPNSRRVQGAAGPYNFMEIEPIFGSQELKLHIKGWGVEEGLLFEKALKIQRRK